MTDLTKEQIDKENAAKDAVLDEIVGVKGAIEDTAKRAAELKATLDKAGKKFKGYTLKAMGPEELADAIIAMLTGEGTPDEKRAKLVAILQDMAKAEGDMGAGDQGGGMGGGMGGMDQAMHASLKLLETVTTGNSDLLALVDNALKEVTGQVKSVTDGLKAVQAEVAPVKGLADKFVAVEKQIKSVSEQLAGRPRRATETPETAVSGDGDLTKAIKQQQETLADKSHKEFWGKANFTDKAIKP